MSLTMLSLSFNGTDLEKLLSASKGRTIESVTDKLKKTFKNFGFTELTSGTYRTDSELTEQDTLEIARVILDENPWLLQCNASLFSSVSVNECIRTLKEQGYHPTASSEDNKQKYSKISAKTRNDIAYLLEHHHELSFSQIARKTGVSTQTVFRHAHKLNIHTNRMNNYVKHDSNKEKEIIKRINENKEMKNKEIAEKVGISNSYVTKVRKKYNIPLKEYRENQRIAEAKKTEEKRLQQMKQKEKEKQQINNAIQTEHKKHPEWSFHRVALHLKDKKNGPSVRCIPLPIRTSESGDYSMPQKRIFSPTKCDLRAVTIPQPPLKGYLLLFLPLLTVYAGLSPFVNV